ncbi:MAG: Type I Iterative PKS [Cirrosporium novae-zelandiae]|nr:MAG: Type I Iterative PKS [Cirrosporium novae-zelandiae]
MASQHVLLFGDQTVEKLPSIRNLVQLSRTSPSLRRFLQEATDVVQAETMKVSPSERKWFSSFHSILALAEDYAKQEDPDEVVATVLMCIERLGELILYVENDPTILTAPDSNVHILGFCTGLLPGAVAAFARDTSELFKFGLEIVSISFRLAIEFTRRSKRIDESPESWACTVVGATAEELQAILDDFNYSQGLPIPRHAYLGVISRTWTTIFGPPSVLARLWSYSSDLTLAPKLKIAAAAAVHAAHLPLPDLEKIVGTSPLLDTPVPAKASIISSSTCKPFEASNLRELLYLMIQDVTQNTLRMEATVQAVISKIIGKGDVKLTAVGPTNHTTLVQRNLQNSGLNVTLTDAVKPLPTAENVRGGSDLIAIVGMSGRFPGGNNLPEFWETLRSGADVHQQIPKSRFDLDTYFDPTGAVKNTATTQYGCFLDNPGVFDTRLFNVSPREAAQMDPLQRLVLMISYEAMEMAGYTQNGSLSTNSSRIATYFGQSGDDWRYINESQGVDIYYVPGTVRAFAPGRLNYHFKWGGPYYSLDAACASSSTAVHLACSALIARECDTAVAGGGSLLTAPPMFAGLSRGSFLSTTGACKTFDDGADGYCRGEGVGMVVLKRLEDAISDNDNIQAVVRGAARTYSAEAVSITQPHAETQEMLFRKVLQQTSVDPEDVGFVEMHGTGTQAGDTVEMTSVTNVFGKRRTKDNPLVVGAVKANVGHGEAAAGITSLIKTVLMLKENTIPPQPGMPFPTNHKFPPLEKMNVRIADKAMNFKAYSKGDGKRKILLNNFDAAGGNTSLLIEDPPVQEEKTQDPRPYHIVTCSARTAYSLNENKRRLLDHLASNPNLKISDIAYTTSARRLHDGSRSAYIAQTTKEIIDKLSADLASDNGAKPSGGYSSVVFAFTGQGSQYSGMGRTLFHSSPKFREIILSYQELCDIQGLPSFIDLISNDEEDIASKTPVQVQLAIVALEIALANLWRSWGITPDMVIGHSLGEYAALCVSGVLSVSDTLYLVGKRAQLMEEKCTPGTHAMLAIASSPESLQSILADTNYHSCQISCLNAPNMTVVSGMVEEIKGLQGRLQDDAIKTTLLQVPYGFHSPQIDPILEDFEASAKGIYFGKPAVPVASTLIAEIVTEAGTFNPTYLAEQARNAVNFVGALQTGKSKGVVDDNSLFLEIGPQPVCLGLIRTSLEVPSTKLLSTLKSGEDDWKTISTSIASLYVSKAPFDWPEYHKEFIKGLRLLELPTYAFDLKNYWNSYKPDEKNIQAVPASVKAEPVSTFSTTCLQRVEKESFAGNKISVTFASNTCEPKLYNAVQGHIVDGIALCPASVFYDMAFTAARYIYTKANPGMAVPHMELSNLEITHALVVPSINPEQIIKVTATKSGADSSVDVFYSSTEGASSHEHGHCQVLFEDENERKSEWTRSLHLVKKRIDALVKSSQSGAGHRLMKPIVYKLFANLVDYDQKYQAIEEVFLDNGFSDAAANVKLGPSLGLGSFTYSPYWTDAIVHLSGFVLNGNFSKPDDIAYISTGLESLRIIGELSEDKDYTCYTSIEPSNEKGLSLGDVYLFDGSELVALCTGIKFQKMTKAVFGIISGKNAIKASQKPGGPVGTNLPKKRLQAPATKTSSKGKAQLSSKNIRNVTQLEEDASHSSSESDSSASTPPSSVDGRDEPDMADLFLDAVAAETGFQLDDMEPSTLFSDMGVDSLMSIAIISAFKKQTGTELPASFFNNCPTVAEMREELGSTPKPIRASKPPKTVSTPRQETPEPTSDEPDAADILLSAVATETGFDAEDMEPSTLFSDMGVDSLMSIAIIAAFKKETDVELPASFFNNYPTVADVRAELGKAPEAAPKPKKKAITPTPVASPAPPTPKMATHSTPKQAPKPRPKSEVAKRAASPEPAQEENAEGKPTYSSKVVLMQGRSSSPEIPLFLITDGAGSATAYIHLPPLPGGRRIYALESPFLHCPEDYTCTISDMASMYLAAIRKTQPQGPYLVGGWSAGGVYAYETARMLLAQGEEIRGLIIIDMRVPRSIPDALEPTMELVEQTGLITGIKRSGNLLDLISQKQKQHLLSTLKALVVFDPIPMDPAHRPENTFIIWATQGLDEVAGAESDEISSAPAPATAAAMGVVGSGNGKGGNNMEDPETGLRSWFYAKRYTFGPNGWDKLVGEKGIECHKIEADHFSMVAPPLVKDLGKLLKQAVEKFMG